MQEARERQIKFGELHSVVDAKTKRRRGGWRRRKKSLPLSPHSSGACHIADVRIKETKLYGAEAIKKSPQRLVSLFPSSPPPKKKGEKNSHHAATFNLFGERQRSETRWKSFFFSSFSRDNGIRIYEAKASQFVCIKAERLPHQPSSLSPTQLVSH
jgi:hypothetical protein